MPVRMQTKGNPHSLLVRVGTEAASMEISVKAFQRVKIETGKVAQVARQENTCLANTRTELNIQNPHFKNGNHGGVCL